MCFHVKNSYASQWNRGKLEFFHCETIKIFILGRIFSTNICYEFLAKDLCSGFAYEIHI